MLLDVIKVKKDFPIFERLIEGHELVYLDSAATSQKPRQVVDAITDYYFNHNANVHRGVHTLGDESTVLYDLARKKVAEFIGARAHTEVIFTKNTTDSLNMIAWCWGLSNLKKGDVVLTLISEHNSSALPWQAVAQKTGAVLDYLYVDKGGEVSLSALQAKFSEHMGKVKVLAMAHASNVLGTIFPVKEFCLEARKYGILTVIDGAQAVPHLEVNVQSLGCDFYAFSGHKMLGPMGIGVLWGRPEL